MSQPVRYIHEVAAWPSFAWDQGALASRLADIHFRRGILLASMSALGLQTRQQSMMQTLVQDVTQSSRIEGETLDIDQVRSSVARRLGLDNAGLPRASRDVDGVVEMTLDATQHFGAPVTEARLFGWHAALFPTGHSGIHRIEVGRWRSDVHGPMQVVGGAMGRETVHFEAPGGVRVPEEMRLLLNWLAENQNLDPIVKAALTHLHFLTIHPFEDGNGRIGRALTDLMLARADGSAERYYSMSTQIELHRRSYYDILERTQRQTDLDVTDWLLWFLDRLLEALAQSEEALRRVRLKRRFWEDHRGDNFNARQRRVLDLLFEDFHGKLQRDKYAKLTGCSAATAQRDLAELVSLGALVQTGTARATRYHLALPDEDVVSLYRPNRR